MPIADRPVDQEVYLRSVRSLFNDPGLRLAVGLVNALVVCVVYMASRDVAYLALSAAFVVSLALRFLAMRYVFPSRNIIDLASARRAESAFSVLLFLQSAVVGGFAFTAFVLSPSAFAQLAAVTVITGFLVTGVGRNFGARHVVAILAPTVVLPLILGLFLAGDLAHLVLGFYVLAMFLLTARMARGLRHMLETSVHRERRSGDMTARFDRALDTMTHGIVMLDREGRIVIANSRAAHALGMHDSGRLENRTLRALFLRVAASGLMMARDATRVSDDLMHTIARGGERTMQLDLTDRRHLELVCRASGDQLAVITVEEVTRKVESEDRIRHMARFDGLTGLANRDHFRDRVLHALPLRDPARMAAVIVLDLDEFRAVNDSLGHAIGDALLCEAAARLRTFENAHGIAGRVGGDEFALYLDDLADRSDLSARVETMLQAMRSETVIEGHRLQMLLRAGVALAIGETVDADGLTMKAELALHRAKEQDTTSWLLFDEGMDNDYRRKQRLKSDLRTAIEGGQMRVVYQPIVASISLEVSSCEALCRWDHPEFGQISPAVFIPLAEELGIISAISRFVLDTACSDCVRWPERVGVAVNLSAKDFRSPDIVAHVRDTLAASGLQPRRLVIEVTETALLDDKAQMRTYIDDLKALGVRIALDDFGTGYSSLSYLHTLPLDKIKIDRSFLSDITTNRRALDLLRSIVDLARPLGLAVTVEGVETIDQYETLVGEIGTDLMQGYLFSRPVPAAAIAELDTRGWSFAANVRRG